MRRRSEDFPLPEGPTTATTPPGKLALTSRNAWTSPEEVRCVRVTPSSTTEASAANAHHLREGYSARRAFREPSAGERRERQQHRGADDRLPRSHRERSWRDRRERVERAEDRRSSEHADDSSQDERHEHLRSELERQRTP